MVKKEHYFYDKPIFIEREKQYIEKLLKKYKNQHGSEELKKQIWDELQNEKQLGNIHVPFKVALRKDLNGKYPNFVEVILDTKV